MSTYLKYYDSKNTITKSYQTQKNQQWEILASNDYIKTKTKIEN
jgi:hypothetical protein